MRENGEESNADQRGGHGVLDPRSSEEPLKVGACDGIKCIF